MEILNFEQDYLLRDRTVHSIDTSIREIVEQPSASLTTVMYIKLICNNLYKYFSA